MLRLFDKILKEVIIHDMNGLSKKIYDKSQILCTKFPHLKWFCKVEINCEKNHLMKKNNSLMYKTSFLPYKELKDISNMKKNLQLDP